MLTTWNTGRLYQEVGQRIAAEYDSASRTIYFVDIDRMVEGTIQQAGLIDNARELQSIVMHRYDHGQYDCYIRDRAMSTKLNRFAMENAPTLTPRRK